jgi:uncharacterized protein
MIRHGIDLQSEDLKAFCRRWSITELAVFGSILGDDFRPDSDVDLLVSFSDDAAWDLIDFLRMQDEASAILGRSVDLVSRRGMEEEANRIVSGEVLRTAEPIYATR